MIDNFQEYLSAGWNFYDAVNVNNSVVNEYVQQAQKGFKEVVIKKDAFMDTRTKAHKKWNDCIRRSKDTVIWRMKKIFS